MSDGETEENTNDLGGQSPGYDHGQEHGQEHETEPGYGQEHGTEPGYEHDQESEQATEQGHEPEHTAAHDHDHESEHLHDQPHEQQHGEEHIIIAPSEGAISPSDPARAALEALHETKGISPDPEPDKRISEAEPEELAHALKKVFNGTVEKPFSAPAFVNSSRTKVLPLPVEQPAPAQELKPEPAQSKSGYDNPFALFADVFYGVLVAPYQTLTILSDCKKFPPTAGNICLTAVLVLGVLSLPAAIKIGAGGGMTLDVLKACLFVLDNIFNWFVLAMILYYLGIWLRGHKLTPGNALIATGWAYLPFAFFAPVACFRVALGSGFTIFACLPALWFVLLQWIAFQTSLRTSAIKLALIALVVPPVFCLVYLFWIGLAVIALLAQLISHLA